MNKDKFTEEYRKNLWECGNSNLLFETITYLKKFDKSPNDVIWVGSDDGSMAITWDRDWETK